MPDRVHWNVMDLKLGVGTVGFAPNQVMRIDHGRGALIRCLDGLIWITQQHDIKDYVLTAGDTVRIDDDGPALIQAIKPASLHLAKPVVCINLSSGVAQ